MKLRGLSGTKRPWAQEAGGGSLRVPARAERRGRGLGGCSLHVLEGCVLHSVVRSLQISVFLLFIILALHIGVRVRGQPCEGASFFQGGD